MTNNDIANKIFESYSKVTGSTNRNMAKEHANALIDAQIQLMYKGEDIKIIKTSRELYLEDWEEIRYLINTK